MDATPVNGSHKDSVAMDDEPTECLSTPLSPSALDSPHKSIGSARRWTKSEDEVLVTAVRTYQVRTHVVCI